MDSLEIAIIGISALLEVSEDCLPVEVLGVGLRHLSDEFELFVEVALQLDLHRCRFYLEAIEVVVGRENLLVSCISFEEAYSFVLVEKAFL